MYVSPAQVIVDDLREEDITDTVMAYQHDGFFITSITRNLDNTWCICAVMR